MLRIFPGLREGPVIEEHVAPLVFSKDTILHILLDGIHGFSGGDLVLLSRPLRDFANEIVRAVWVSERDVMPRGQARPITFEPNAESSRADLPLRDRVDGSDCGLFQA